MGMNDSELLALLPGHSALVRSLAQSNARYHDTSSDPAQMLLVEGEFVRRINFCEDLLGSGRAEGVDRIALLESCAAIGHDIFGLVYDADPKFGQWVSRDDDGSTHAPLSRRTDNYLDRLLSAKARSFPKIDAALIAFSYGLPLEVWEAGSRDAFNEFVQLEAARRRGAQKIKPLLAFTPLDYLLTLARDAPHLQVYDDAFEAAQNGIKAAQEQLTLEGLAGTDDANLRAARPAVQIPVVAAEKRLWFRCAVQTLSGPQEGLLFEVFPAVGGGSASERGIGLLSNAVSHGSDLTFTDVFESPKIPFTGIELLPSEDSELILFIVRKADLRSLPFFQRSRDDSLSLELSNVDIDDLRRCILRTAPEDRHILRRKIHVR